jgi:hypothetical protein
MDNIIEPNDTFDFTTISLAHPFGIQGGAYFTKIQFNNKPLYIQTSKTLTRQGFVKTGKKYYCDLMFDKNAESLIHWFENLEEKCHKLIYEKKDAWFQGNLEENDIETAFNPVLRVYKSGKYYLLRTNIKNTKDDMPVVKIYNEKETILDINDVTPETEIISILEIQGIKFTSRNFQIDIELKQVMVLDNEPIFESCLIRPKKNENSLEELSVLSSKHKNVNLSEAPLIEAPLMNDHKNNAKQELFGIDALEEPQDISQANVDKEELVAIEFEDLMEDIEETNNNDELKEVSNNDLHLDKNDLSITLKKPNEVYFELYKDARNKAKQAKKNAILAYLEAKNIKKTYMLENMNDSDSDFETELDEVSESELEGL